MKIHFRPYIYDVYIINFCRPHTRVFYFFVQKEGHYLAASLLISLCQEHFICPVCDNCTALVVCPYMRVFPLLNRSDVFLVPLTRRQKNSVSNSKTTIYTYRNNPYSVRLSPVKLVLCVSRVWRSVHTYTSKVMRVLSAEPPLRLTQVKLIPFYQ